MTMAEIFWLTSKAKTGGASPLAPSPPAPANHSSRLGLPSVIIHFPFQVARSYERMSSSASKRLASHAGSWYTEDGTSRAISADHLHLLHPFRYIRCNAIPPIGFLLIGALIRSSVLKTDRSLTLTSIQAQNSILSSPSGLRRLKSPTRSSLRRLSEQS